MSQQAAPSNTTQQPSQLLYQASPVEFAKMLQASSPQCRYNKCLDVVDAGNHHLTYLEDAYAYYGATYYFVTPPVRHHATICQDVRDTLAEDFMPSHPSFRTALDSITDNTRRVLAQISNQLIVGNTSKREDLDPALLALLHDLDRVQ